MFLFFVKPQFAGGKLIGFGRRDEPGREGTLQHGGINEMGQRLLQLRPIPGVGAQYVGIGAFLRRPKQQLFFG
jgi:hypothetical protein